MLTLDGDLQVIFNLERMADNVEDEANQRLEELGKDVLERAQQLVPVDTGRLRDSGRLKVSRARANIEFTEDYALHVHERTDIAHSNGQAKFLEQAIMEFADRFTDQFDQSFLDRLL